MAGLQLNMGAGGGVGFAPQLPGSTAPRGSTISQAAFGSSSGSAAKGSGLRALVPNDPGGTAFWLGVGGVALLLLIRHSLPR